MNIRTQDKIMKDIYKEELIEGLGVMLMTAFEWGKQDLSDREAKLRIDTWVNETKARMIK